MSCDETSTDAAKVEDLEDPVALARRLAALNERIDAEIADGRQVGARLRKHLEAKVGDICLILYGDEILIGLESGRRTAFPIALVQELCAELTRLSAIGPLPPNINQLIKW